MAFIKELPKAWEALCNSILSMEDNELRAVEVAMRMMRQNIAVVRNRPPLAPVIPLGGYWGRLPVEICSRIFEFGDPVIYDPVGVGSPSHSGYPIILSLVSKDWRVVALDTPRIWSNIVLGNHINMRHAHSLPRGKLWLSRSEHVPVQIFMGLSLPNSPRVNLTPLETAQKKVYFDAMTTISTNLHHCVRLNISVETISEVEVALFQLQHPAPLLRQFGIHPGWQESDHEPNMAIENLLSGLFSNQSPLLASASLVHLPSSWPQSLIGNLTVFDMTFNSALWPLSTALALFEGTPMLTTLTLSEFYLSASDGYFDVPVVTNSSIQTFKIVCRYADHAVLLLNKLELPALQVLMVLCDLNDSMDLSSSSSQSQFPAIKLFRFNCNFNPVTLYDLLKRMENLRTMVCTHPNEIDILSKVSHNGNPSLPHILCPRLEELSVEYRHTIVPHSLASSIGNLMLVRKNFAGALALKWVMIPSFESLGRELLDTLNAEGAEFGVQVKFRDELDSADRFEF